MKGDVRGLDAGKIGTAVGSGGGGLKGGARGKAAHDSGKIVWNELKLY